jgi:ribosomal protein S21
MVVVKKKQGESEDRLISRFRKKVLRAGIIPEARERREFKSKSEERKEKKYKIKHLQELEKKRNY